MNDGVALTIAGVGIALAVPLTFMVANWVRKNIDHGEARFDSETGKVVGDKPPNPAAPATPAKPDEAPAKDRKSEM